MLSDLVFRLRSLFRRNTVETELDGELRFPFEQEVEKSIRSGMTREVARRQARLSATQDWACVVCLYSLPELEDLRHRSGVFEYVTGTEERSVCQGGQACSSANESTKILTPRDPFAGRASRDLPCNSNGRGGLLVKLHGGGVAGHLQIAYSRRAAGISNGAFPVSEPGTFVGD